MSQALRSVLSHLTVVARGHKPVSSDPRVCAYCGVREATDALCVACEALRQRLLARFQASDARARPVSEPAETAFAFTPLGAIATHTTPREWRPYAESREPGEEG